MTLQPDDLSSDTAAIADGNLHTDSSSRNIASTCIPAMHQQGWRIRLFFTFLFGIDKSIDSAFLRLPLELRLMIYNHTVDFNHLIPWRLTFIPDDQSEDLKAIAQLSSMSRQVHYEMPTLLANKLCVVEMNLTRGRDVLPCRALLKYPKAYEQGSGEWKDLDLDAPRNFKFRRVVFLAVTPKFPGTFIAIINFKKRVVIRLCAFRAKAVSNHSTNPLLPPKKGEGLSPEATQTSEESLNRSIQAVAEQEGFDGFTFGNMHLLLHKLKVSVPDSSGDWSVLFEDADAVPIEKGGE